MADNRQQEAVEIVARWKAWDLLSDSPNYTALDEKYDDLPPQADAAVDAVLDKMAAALRPKDAEVDAALDYLAENPPEDQ